MLIEIRATFKCDFCGQEFSIQIDPAYKSDKNESAFDLAEDAVRGSVDYLGPNNANGTRGSSSVQNDKHLCGPCTSEEDQRA